MYKVYCVADICGTREQLPPVHFDSVEGFTKYVILHKPNFAEVIVEDEDEYCVLHAVDGKVVFPKEIAGY